MNPGGNKPIEAKAGSMTFVRLWCGEDGRLGGSWIRLGAGVEFSLDIV
jgi:hypothetical protein